ncbi:MAG: hypothetical protein AAGF75_04815 [Cyanobacteria bacterium P01_H01_bin.130]
MQEIPDRFFGVAAAANRAYIVGVMVITADEWRRSGSPKRGRSPAQIPRKTDVDYSCPVTGDTPLGVSPP